MHSGVHHCLRRIACFSTSAVGILLLAAICITPLQDWKDIGGVGGEQGSKQGFKATVSTKRGRFLGNY